MAAYVRRIVDPLIAQLMTEVPALLLVGPRATGKTTTAARHAASIVRLDRPAEAAVFQADPDAALRGLAEPVLLDEWQEVPTVLGAVKRAVDQDSRPGRYLLTGSVRAELDASTWAGTGRLVRVPMFSMAVREVAADVESPGLIDRLVSGDVLVSPGNQLDLRGYVELAGRSGFPAPLLAMTSAAARHWLEAYVDQVLTRDAMGVDGSRDPARLRRYFEAYALNTAGNVQEATLIQAAGINRKTAVAYERLLLNLMVVDALPAWTSNRLKRLSLGSKRYLIDAGLLAAALRLEAQAFMQDGDLLGRLIDTFVVAQLRAEVATSASRPRLYHLREEHGRHEVDVVAELGGDRVLAFEIKASSAPTPHDARHLVWLRGQLGDRFVRGVVFHTGPRPFALADGIDAVPICALWGGARIPLA